MRDTRPLEVAVADLRRHPGTRREYAATALLPDLAISTASVPDGAVVDLDLVLESLSNQIVVTGTVAAPWTGECRRCLVPVKGRAQAAVHEIFDPHPVDGETYPLGDDLVDLEPLVRDAVLLALPLAPLCRPDCPGPAPETFPTGPPTTEELEGRETPPDPRWAALDALDFDES